MAAEEPSWPAQWLRGPLELCVLALVAERETYGYAISQRLAEARLGLIKGGTIYPILLRLEEDGLVTSGWQAGQGGPGRKLFRITARGQVELRRRRMSWAEFTAATNELLAGVADRSTKGAP
jgi:PadR family transcriptional regulator, regulatory protein PadR